MAGNSAGSVAVDLVLNTNAFNNQVKNSVKSTEGAFTTSFKKIGTVIAAAFAVEKVVEFGKSCVQAASDAQAAWTGLNSIVEGTGNNFDVAHSFLTKFTQDGLVGIEDAATAYKNLLSRGYDTTQIESVMTALKDSAAFGRQSSYSLTQAIVSATEGLKNENSILVDNAGVTKNVAKMWDEYAESIGTTANNLTQQQKIQAEVNGILTETRFQAGDAATYTQTFAGRVQVLQGAFSSMQIAIGKVVAPIASVFIPVITNAINVVTAFFTRLQAVMSVFGFTFPDVVKKTSTGIDNMGASAVNTAKDIAGTGTAAKKAAKEVNKAFSSVDEINVISNKKSKGSSSDGTSGIGGAGSVAVTPIAADDGAVKVAVSETMQKVISAFQMVGASLQPLGETIFSGLKWAYDNVLVPLAKWTIGEILPAFLKGLSGAIDILNGVIENLKPIFKWFWDTFLQPVAAWTGGIIADVLNAIGDALKWIGQNEVAVAIISGIAISMGLVNGALALYNTVGGIANGIMLAYNGIMAIASGVTTAFSAAMAFLTSPITLVVAAIAAVIAIVILLVKHWDEVKAVASKCWEGIKTAWNAAGAWFKEKVVTPVSNFFSNMWNSLKSGASTAWNNIKNAFNSVGSFFSGIWNTIKSKFTNIGQNIGNAVSSAFKKAFNAVMQSIENVANAPINAINKLREIINKVPGVNIGKLDTFKLPRLAQGGWVGANNPQLAIIGDNTREGEIVAPESKIREQVKQAIAEMGTAGQKFVMDLNLKIQTDDGRSIIKKINDVTIQDGYVSILI